MAKKTDNVQKNKNLELSPLQKRFVEFYDGNATEACRKAGYSEKCARQAGTMNMKTPKIIRAIRTRENNKKRTNVAKRIERQEFWSKTMRDIKIDIQHRLKASELLGKSEADFTDRLVVTKPLLIIKDLSGEG
jgi:phage terminase small subunit